MKTTKIMQRMNSRMHGYRHLLGLLVLWTFLVPLLSGYTAKDQTGYNHSRKERVFSDGYVPLFVASHSNGGDFVRTGFATASIVVAARGSDGKPVPNIVVTWRVVAARNDSPAMAPGWSDKKTGLTWGSGNPPSVMHDRILELEINATSTTGADGKTTMQLTDIIGERTITVEAKAVIGSEEYTVLHSIRFGKGPLSIFSAPDGATRTWGDAYAFCNGKAYSENTLKWAKRVSYQGGGKMPTIEEYRAIAPKDSEFGGFVNPSPAAHGAAYAAGWQVDHNYFWTGESQNTRLAFIAFLMDGFTNWGAVDLDYRVVCRR